MACFRSMLVQDIQPFVTVQLLQAVNILFESLKNKQSICEFGMLLKCLKIVFRVDARKNVETKIKVFIHPTLVLTRPLVFTVLLFLSLSGYLLSNNHINTLISHPFDCSNEEVRGVTSF
jgi:hypothetical protein